MARFRYARVAPLFWRQSADLDLSCVLAAKAVIKKVRLSRGAVIAHLDPNSRRLGI